MKRFILIPALLLSCGLAGCRQDHLGGDNGPQQVAVELPLRTDPMTVSTRAADDGALRDVNWWLSDANGNVVLHRYQTAPTLRFECVPGTYRLHVAVNLGRDTGTVTDPGSLSATLDGDSDVLPMACDTQIDIPASAGGVVQLPAVEVTRCAAKISYRIAARPSDMELRSVQLRSVPLAVPLFEPDAAPSNAPEDCTDGKAVALSGRQAAGDLYMLPNEQGTVPAITDQRDKNAANAPRCSSYLLIRAVRGDKVLAYTVYLGENNTSDFNVKANRHYRLDITLVDDNTADTRVAAYTVTVEDTFGALQLGGYSLYTASNKITVTLTSRNDAPNLTGRLEVLEGDVSAFRFDGKTGASYDFTLPQSTARIPYPVSYARIFTQANHRLHYRLTLRDRYGFSTEYDFEHTFANQLQVYAPEGAAVRCDDALHVLREETGGRKRTTILCLDECRMTVEPEAGSTFDGWYADSGYTQKLSSEPEYVYRPESARATLYARCISSATPLDSKGTANCYTPTEYGTWYSFDATVMGNGRATAGIVPKKLTGVAAKVLWETGTTRGAVVEQVACSDGRILFRTGTERGNALIGLFDAAGNCIWSWHIWSVDYEPSFYGQEYASGETFMRENLGAETTAVTDTRSKGLYYQWGRKDPFPFPASADRPTTEGTAAVRCLSGYAFEVRSNTASATKYPASCYTIAWATAHPTVLLSAAPNPAGSNPNFYGSWCYPLDDNLWGTGDGKKTIYDPCPPGWKVPSREAWDMEHFSKSSNSQDCGWNMHYSEYYGITFYPYTGYLSGAGGKYAYCLSDSQTRVWTGEAWAGTLSQSSRDKAYYLGISEAGRAAFANGGSRDEGCPVRCIKE